MKEMYGRQYLKADDIEEYRVKFDGAVHFLDKAIYFKKTAAVGKTDAMLDNIIFKL